MKLKEKCFLGILLFIFGMMLCSCAGKTEETISEDLREGAIIFPLTRKREPKRTVRI
ncbi:MAG: hypothetical protein LUC97_11770 [Clostridiales bacterium]|nr:hypothetical protein [Clostridiales bacterium]